MPNKGIKVIDVWEELLLPEKEYICELLKITLPHLAFVDLKKLEDWFCKTPDTAGNWGLGHNLAYKLEALLVEKGGWPVSPSKRIQKLPPQTATSGD